jgi:2'-5' RNA ligase
MPRLFTGIEMPPEIAQHLTAFRGGLPGARWVEPENYHITLRFIGDVDEAVAADLFEALAERRTRGPLPVSLEALGSFGGRRPHAVFARARGDEALLDLQEEQERLVRRVGLAPETRRFSPHVTLARLRGASSQDVARYIESHGSFPTLSFTATRFVMYSSRASVGGGPYSVEAAYPFA